jgi:hypothetical protein
MKIARVRVIPKLSTLSAMPDPPDINPEIIV